MLFESHVLSNKSNILTREELNSIRRILKQLPDNLGI